MVPSRSKAVRWFSAVLVVLAASTGGLLPADAAGEKIVTGSRDRCDRDESPPESGGRCPLLGALPGMVALIDVRAPDTFLGQFCGGTLIDETHVLTAAHCIGGPMDVLVGQTDLSGSGGQRIRVLSQYAHPGFALGSNVHDLAVLRLASPAADLSVPLLPGGSPDGAPAGTAAELFGWGDMTVDPNDAEFPTTLRATALPIVGDDACATSLPDYDADSEVCAGSGTEAAPAADACQGDSGGPLLVSANNERHQVGIVSRGPTCGESPTAYTDVRAYADFISFTRGLAAARFSDTEGSAHEVAIELTGARGIIDGNAGRYRPGEPVSRGAAAKIVAGALGLTEKPGPGRFSDTAGNVFEGWINAAADAGLLSGFSDGTFRPGINLTRAQVATVLKNALGLTPRQGNEFSDVDGPPHGPNIYALVDGAITIGFDDGTFRPGLNVSRGQLATFLVRGVPSLRFPPLESG